MELNINSFMLKSSATADQYNIELCDNLGDTIMKFYDNNNKSFYYHNNILNFWILYIITQTTKLRHHGAE